MKYKVGDKVRIVDKRTDSMNLDGEMDEYLGSIMTVKFVLDKISVYLMKEDNGEWDWQDDMIAGYADCNGEYPHCEGCYYYNYVDPNPPCEHCGHAEDGMNLYFITEKEYKSIHDTESAIESVCTHNGCEGCKHENKPEYEEPCASCYVSHSNMEDADRYGDLYEPKDVQSVARKSKSDLNHPKSSEIDKLALLNKLIAFMENVKQIGVFTDERKKRSFDITLEDLRDERIARFVKYIDWDEVEHRLNIAESD